MVTCTGKDTNPSYWEEYSNLQYVKHRLIENYLNGWFPKLGRWSGRISYIDTHAGKGRHKSGEKGSPLVALNCIINHKYRKSHLSNCEINLFFIESDAKNCCQLEKEIQSIKSIPKKVKPLVIPEDCFTVLQELIDDLSDAGDSMAPAFVFVDPYGFKIPGSILRRFMEFNRVELFINVIWRELSMAIAQGKNKPGMAKTLDLIFDGEDWRDLTDLPFDDQAEECVNIMRKKTNAKWATHIRMLGPNGATRYMLMHLTNHDSGRDLMKDCIWKVCPEGGYYARASDNPKQQLLIEPIPNFKPLKEKIIGTLSAGPIRWKELLIRNKSEIWRDTHVNKIVRELRKTNIIDGRNYVGKFALTNDPELYLL